MHKPRPRPTATRIQSAFCCNSGALLSIKFVLGQSFFANNLSLIRNFLLKLAKDSVRPRQYWYGNAPCEPSSRSDEWRRATSAGRYVPPGRAGRRRSGLRAWCLESFDALDRFVLWRCGGRRDWADDIVQETWLTAVRRIRRFDPTKGSFLAWLRGIAANIRRSDVRRRKRFAGPPFSNNGHAELADANCNQSSMAAEEKRQEHSEKIAQALDALSDRQEAALRAKYLDGQTVEQIAAAWNETPKAVESLPTRARQAFRERFED